MTFPTNDRRINDRHALDAKGAKSWGAIWKEGKRVFTEPRQRKGDRPAFVDLGLVAVGSLLGAAMYAAVRFGVLLFLLLSVASSVGAGERSTETWHNEYSTTTADVTTWMSQADPNRQSIQMNPQLGGIEFCRGARAVGTIYYDTHTWTLKFKGDQKDAEAVLHEMIDWARKNTRVEESEVSK